MFSKMQKYHKVFLIFITAVIALSFIPFGMGSILQRMLDPENRIIVGTFTVPGGEQIKITKREFKKALQDWRDLFTFAAQISTKAQKAQKVKPDEQPQQYMYLFAQAPKNSLWDAIFSLREDVAKLDHKIDIQIGNPQKWESLLRGDFDFLARMWGLGSLPLYPPIWEEIEAYRRLPENKRTEILGQLPKNDIWNILVLLQQAKQWGVQVSDLELAQFMVLTQKMFPDANAYKERLKGLRIGGADFENTIRSALTIVKYLNIRHGSVKIPTEMAYNEYSKLYTKYSLQWVKTAYNPIVSNDEKLYTKERLDFYDEKVKTDPNYFKIAATTDFDYVLAKTSQFMQQVTLTDQEIEKAYKDAKKKNKNLDEEEESEEEHEHEDGTQHKSKAKEVKEQAIKDLCLKKAGERASNLLKEIRDKVGSLTISVPLEKIAFDYNLQYTSKTNISEDNFAKEEIYSEQVKKQIYEAMKSGKFSPILNVGDGENKKFFLVRLLKKQDARPLTREEVEKDDSLFLSCYYGHTKEEFKTQDRYKLAYIMTDYETINKNLLLTTQIMQDFYGRYKDNLYKIEETPAMEPIKKEDEIKKDETKKDETKKDEAKKDETKKDEIKPKYKPFEEVKTDLENRVMNFMKIKELQNLHVVYDICKKQGKDANIRPIVEEMAKQIMLVKEGLQYTEDTQFKTLDEIKQSNAAQDKDFPASLKTDGELSDVRDTSKGKYFYKLLAHEVGEEPEFKAIQGKVKDHFMKMMEGERLKKNFEAFKKEYEEREQNLTQNYEKRIQVLETTLQAAKDEEKQNISNHIAQITAEKSKLPSQIFQIMAMEQKLEYNKSEPFNKIEDVSEIKNIPQIGIVLNQKEGETGVPILDQKNGQAYLFQMVRKESPELSEIPTSKLERIKKILWQREYRMRYIPSLDHKMLKLQTNLDVKYDEEEESEEDQKPQRNEPDWSDVDY